MKTKNAITVIGLGRVGLPLAIYLAENKFQVFGVDNDLAKLETLNRGEMPFFEERAEPLLKKHIRKGLKFTDDLQYAAKNSAVLILTLGTPVDEFLNPVFSQIESIIKDLNSFLRKGHLLVLRSTVSPGTTEYIKRYIEKHSELKVGKDVFLAFCPERIAEGKSLEELPDVPQIVGVLDEESGKKTAALFNRITSKVLLTDARSAELAKLFCNMFRYINFAVGNEFMVIAEEHDRDIYQIIDLVNNGYKRGGLKSPGFAAGPCLYKDGFFLVNKFPFSELITISWRINEMLPAFLISKIKENREIDSTKVAILGLGFKANIDDTRNSLAFRVKKIFKMEGAEVYLHDPYVSSETLEETLKGADIVVIAMNHDQYKEGLLEKINKYAKSDCTVCDVWNVTGRQKIIFNLKEAVKSKGRR